MAKVWSLIAFAVSFAASSITLQAETYIEERVGEKLPPVIQYSPENGVLSLIESNFFLNHRPGKLSKTNRDAVRRYERLAKRYGSLIQDANKATQGKLETAFEEAVDVYIFFLKSDYISQHEDKMEKLRDMIYKLGEWVYLKEKEPMKRNYVHTLYLSTGLSQPAYLGDAVAKLADKQKDAPSQFRSSIDILIYYNLSSSSSTAKSARMIFNKKTKLDRYEKAIVALIDIERRLEVGEDLISGGKGLDKMNQRLLAINRSTQGIRAPGLRWRINHTILYLWLRLQKSVDWRRAPLVEVREGGKQLIAPLIERIILEEVQDGQLRKGLLTYKNLSNAFRSSPVAVKLDFRYLQIAQMLNDKNKRYEDLALVYNELVKRYEKPNPQYQKISQSASRKIFLSYRKMIRDLQDKAIESKDVALRKRAMLLSREFTNIFKSLRKDILEVKKNLAQLYSILGLHKEAVAEFIDLAREDPLTFYRKASDSQRVLANWPPQPPWGKLPAGNKAERVTLIKIYSAIVGAQAKAQQNISWADLGHLGLLYRVTGQFSNAEVLWSKALPSAEPGTDANGAAGLLLAAYFKQKRWTDFINLTRLCEVRKILPTLEQQVLDMKKFYQVALINRAQVYSKEKKYKEAIVDLEEVVEKYPNDPKRQNILVEVARLYQRLGELTKALVTVRNLVDQYPNSAVSKAMILEAGAWGRDSKDFDILEKTSELYRIYIDNFPNDPKLTEARYERAKILIALKQYTLAAKHLRDHALDKRATTKERVRSALTYVNLERLYGEGNKAISDVIPVIKLARIEFGEENYVLAHTILAQAATEKLAIQDMKREEQILMQYVEKYKEVGEALGFLRFSLAEHYEYEVPFPNRPFGIEEFRPQIESIYKVFQTIKTAYERVCTPKENKYCQNAYERLKQFGQDSLDAIGAVELSGNIQQSMEKVLRDFQQEFLQKVEKDKSKFDDLADKYRIRNERLEEGS
ncbi:tetratricopeptide repeat protein [Pseudobacteriovorax antillogorgiicola]|uniref:Tetratricopeptide repeat-containing protein n=1 Tax=Pseudobacteriovorax antillogorgiicola TaxID=1513793 RepID=A0A1Y6BE03_9BACT|nr:tetratricopeptide repeat protein [Pseudobacteriovorax antillogorgiicola]TCS56458.1 tetratricopeptide repeat protein [Pseudobacteriovorax antillogorgiicola]SMF05224.1 Tetratricopeptide repeat-containing protein [Pseudobacteriovorax antillogorgiicola]